jgi:hypothetical protein
MTVEFSAQDDSGGVSLVVGATKDPGLPLNGSSAVCPSSVPAANCTAFELLCAIPTSKDESSDEAAR